MLNFEFSAYVLSFMGWAPVVEVVLLIAAGCFRWTVKTFVCLGSSQAGKISNILSYFRKSWDDLHLKAHGL